MKTNSNFSPAIEPHVHFCNKKLEHSKRSQTAVIPNETNKSVLILICRTTHKCTPMHGVAMKFPELF